MADTSVLCICGHEQSKHLGLERGCLACAPVPDQHCPWFTFPGASPAVPESDAVDHPPHYTSHPSGVECIDVVEHMPFSIGNAVKYLWRAGLKGDALEDLKKARWYIDREIARRSKP